MCGLFGCLSRQLPGDRTARFAAVLGAQQHRGPDASAIWQDPDRGIALVHNRLKLLELSERGAQPMVSADGRLVVVYNGEIYNHLEIRQELLRQDPARRFRGHSDTETLVEAISAWGLEPALERLAGMFAFAVWDRVEMRLTLVRDRLGIKPLYWAQLDGSFMFASELKAMWAWRGSTLPVDEHAFAAYLTFGYVPAPATIHPGVFKLEPGTLLTLQANGRPDIRRYWDFNAVARQSAARGKGLTEAGAIELIRAELIRAVRQHLLADVPVGAFLSGGVDSSVVVALMQAAQAGTVSTYSIGFSDAGYDESAHAARVAAHLGTKHTAVTLEETESMDVIPRLPEIYDEPFADSSQIPTYLVSRLARRDVTVALSGDGGDETFGGYNRHAFGAWPLLRRIPGPLAALGRAGVHLLSPMTWDRLGACVPGLGKLPQAGDKLYKLADLLGADEPAAYMRLLTQGAPNFAARVHGFPQPVLPDWPVDFGQRMQAADTLGYLPDDILTKVDRASMAVSLEARVPLLDHRVLEAAWSLPGHLRQRHGRGKWILRRILADYVPDHLVQRPKSGFAVPVGRWLRSGLRQWAEDLLAPARLARSGHFAVDPVRHAWQAHQSGAGDFSGPLWTVLMFQAWHERWIKA